MEFKHDICIVGLKCLDLLVEAETPKYLGGIERILVALAKGLVDHGKKVAFVTFNEGLPLGAKVHGITVYQAYSVNTGIKGVRFFHPKATSIYRAMSMADAEYYLQMGAGTETAVTAAIAQFCLKGRRKFFYCVGSDSDCQRNPSLIESSFEKSLYKWGLRHADLVVSQTETQKELLIQNSDLGSVVIPMPYQSEEKDLPALDLQPQYHAEFLWIGRIMREKRLEMYLDLARANGNYHFNVVGNPNVSSSYATDLLEEAKAISNVTVHGLVSEDKLNQLYRTCKVLFCTSEIEGFPTTFLEAWSQKMPIITTFDPDGVVETGSLGCVVTSLAELNQALETVMAESAHYHRLSRNCYEFYNANYTIAAVVPKYLAKMRELSNS